MRDRARVSIATTTATSRGPPGPGANSGAPELPGSPGQLTRHNAPIEPVRTQPKSTRARAGRERP